MSQQFMSINLSTLTRELEQPVLAYHHLLDEVTLAQTGALRAVKCGEDLAARHQCQTLYALEVGVLNSHHTVVREQLLWVVVDQLSVTQ